MILALLFTAVVSNYVFCNGNYSLWQKIVYADPGLRIRPTYQYLPIFGILTILGTILTEIVWDVVFEVRNGSYSLWQKIVYAGPGLRYFDDFSYIIHRLFQVSNVNMVMANGKPYQCRSTSYRPQYNAYIRYL